MKEKKVDIEFIAIALKIGLEKIWEDVDSTFESWPESSNGTLVKLKDVRVGMLKLEEYSIDKIESILGQKLPEVEIPVEPEPVEPVEPIVITEDVLIYTMKLRQYKNKSFNWIDNHITDRLKNNKIKFVFNNGCGTLIVPNGSVTHGEDGRSNNYNQLFYFCGTDFDPSESENNNYMASVFTAPGCVSTSVDIYIMAEKIVEPEPEEQPYETKFHHTTCNSSDGGTSLVLCPGQRINFDSVTCDGVVIPRHADDNNRETWWHMFKVMKGDIIAKKGDRVYRYPGGKSVTYGDC